MESIAKRNLLVAQLIAEKSISSIRILFPMVSKNINSMIRLKICHLPKNGKKIIFNITNIGIELGLHCF